MSIGILPNVNSIKLNRDAKRGVSVCSRIIRLTNNQKKKKKKLPFPKRKRTRRQKCCSYCENCTTIGVCLARLGVIRFSKRQTVPEKPDAKSLGTNSKSTIHPVYATASKYPGKNSGPSLGKIQVKHLHQRSPNAFKN